MEMRLLISEIDLNMSQLCQIDEIESICKKESIEIYNLPDLRDFLIYLEEKHSDYPQLNKIQIGIIENKVEEAIAAEEKKIARLDKATQDTARAVAKTTAGTIGREVGKEIGEKVGGTFGKKLGGNVGAELARSIVRNFTKK